MAPPAPSPLRPAFQTPVYLYAPDSPMPWWQPHEPSSLAMPWPETPSSATWPATPHLYRGVASNHIDAFADRQRAQELYDPAPPISSPLPWGLAPLGHDGRPVHSFDGPRTKTRSARPKLFRSMSFDDHFREMADMLPRYATDALALLMDTRNLARPPLRRRLVEAWPSFTRAEQLQVFAPRPWAHFVWLALGAMAEQRITLEKMAKNHSKFYRQVQAYYLVGGVDGLQQFLDCYNDSHSLQGVRARTTQNEEILALYEEWVQLGLPLVERERLTAWQAPLLSNKRHRAKRLGTGKGEAGL